jgi:hypothetical protein
MTGAEAIAHMLKVQGAEYLFSFPDHLLVEPVAALGIRPIIREPNGLHSRWLMAMQE